MKRTTAVTKDEGEEKEGGLRKELLEALQLVKPGLVKDEKGTVDQGDCFAFLPSHRVLTFNGEMTISADLPKEVEVVGAVPAEPLFQLLDKMTEDELEVSINGSEFRVKCGRVRSGISYHSEVLLPSLDLTGKWKPLPTDFLEALKFVMYSCSKDFSAPVITCVHVDFKNERVESTDNFRATRFEIEGEGKGTALIPSTTVKELVGYELGEVLEEKEDSGWIHFRTTDKRLVFSCRTFSGKFPDLDKSGLFEFKKGEGISIELPKSLGEVLERSSVFSTREYFLDEKVEVNLKKNRLMIRGEGPDGWIEEEVNVKYSGEEHSFYIHPQFLQDMLPRTRDSTILDNRVHFDGDNWVHVAALTGLGE